MAKPTKIKTLAVIREIPFVTYRSTEKARIGWTMVDVSAIVHYPRSDGFLGGWS
jgi:hypothetical protein